MNQRLCHEVAGMMTQHCIELLTNVLDEQQKQQTADGIYQIFLAGIEAYVIYDDRIQRRLHPLSN